MSLQKDTLFLVLEDPVLMFRGTRDCPMPHAHTHSDIELSFIERGEAVYQFFDKEVKVGAGSVLMFSAATPHQRTYGSEDLFYTIINIPIAIFDSWRLEKGFSEAIFNNEVVVERDPSMEALDRLRFKCWYEDWKKDARRSIRYVMLEAQARIERIAQSESRISHRTQSRRKVTDVSSPEKIDLMVQFILKSFGDPLKLKNIADAAKLNPKYATEIFRRRMGISPMEYLSKHRLAHSKRLLLTTDMKVIDIALESGFGSLSRFYEAFNKEFGISPGKIRESE